MAQQKIDYKQLAAALAKEGTGKDNMLVHMNRAEFKQTEKNLGFTAGKNPTTGLPSFDEDLSPDAGADAPDAAAADEEANTKSDEDYFNPNDSTESPEEAIRKGAYAGQSDDQKKNGPKADPQAESFYKQFANLQKRMSVMEKKRSTNTLTAGQAAQKAGAMLGDVADNVFGKETGTAIRDGANFVATLPNKLAEYFSSNPVQNPASSGTIDQTIAAHAKALRTSQNILQATMPNVASGFLAPYSPDPTNPGASAVPDFAGTVMTIDPTLGMQR